MPTHTRSRSLWGTSVVVVFLACGSRAFLDDGGLVADAAIDAEAAAPFPPVDASPPVEASTWDVNVTCSASEYWVSVTDDAGTHVLDAGCTDGGVPSTTDVGCGNKITCPVINACGAGSITMRALVPPVPFESLSASVDWTPSGGDASTLGGNLLLTTWPNVGGTVAGGFLAGPIQGTFCVERR